MPHETVCVPSTYERIIWLTRNKKKFHTKCGKVNSEKRILRFSEKPQTKHRKYLLYPQCFWLFSFHTLLFLLILSISEKKKLFFFSFFFCSINIILNTYSLNSPCVQVYNERANTHTQPIGSNLVFSLTENKPLSKFTIFYWIGCLVFTSLNSNSRKIFCPEKWKI